MDLFSRTGILLMGLLLAVTACQKETEWELKDDGRQVVVIDGMVTNERKRHEVRITYLAKELYAEPLPVTDAKVSIHLGDTMVTLSPKPGNPGIYRTDPIRAPYNRTYKLVVRQQGNIYYAYANMEPVNPFINLSYRLDNEKDSLYVINDISQYNLYESAMYEVNIDWSSTGYCNGTDSCKAVVKYFTLNTIDINQIFTMEKEKISFPKGTRLIVSKFSLTDEHAAFIRTMLSETQWKGGYFDVESANLASNIEGGAIGFFAASSVYKDTIVVQ